MNGKMKMFVEDGVRSKHFLFYGEKITHAFCIAGEVGNTGREFVFIYY
jgi:hypothetical protein